MSVGKSLHGRKRLSFGSRRSRRTLAVMLDLVLRRQQIDAWRRRITHPESFFSHAGLFCQLFFSHVKIRSGLYDRRSFRREAHRLEDAHAMDSEIIAKRFLDKAVAR